MIIIDVDFATIREMSVKETGLSFFYTEDADKFTIYKEFNGMLFRNVQMKEGDPMQDQVFRASNLMNAKRVEAVHPENSVGEEWREYFTQLYNMVKDIKDRRKR